MSILHRVSRKAPPAGLVLALALLFPGPVTAQREVAVERGARLALSSLSGTLVIEGWDRDAVRVERGEGAVRQGGPRGTVRVEPDRRRGRGSFHLLVPAWMAVTVDGVNLEVAVRGVMAPIRVETVNGDVRVEGGRDEIRLESVSGSVWLERSRGRIVLESVHGNLTGHDLAGEVRAETTNGSVRFRDAALQTLDARSVNGDLLWEGAPLANGRYLLDTHNGSVRLRLPATVSAVVTTTTFHGDLRSDFPVRTAPGGLGRTIRFTLGRGGPTRIDITTFQGEIVLERMPAPPPRR